MGEYQNVKLSVEGRAALLVVDRPKALNALDSATIAELSEAVEEVRGSGVRGLVITGGGEKAFVAGADIRAMSQLSVAEAYALSRQGHALGAALEALPIPVVAAVNGFALGGGCELAMACDIIYASQTARFGQPEVKLGVIPGFGGTQRLARLVGTQRARELVFTGRIIDAEEALRIGLVARVLEPEALLPAALALVEAIADMGPQAVATAKRAILDGWDMPLTAANDMEAKAFADIFGSAEQQEGMAAFLEKRKPQYG